MVAFEFSGKATSVPPRALEPLIALTMTKDAEAADAVFLKSDLVEQILTQYRRAARIPLDPIGQSAGAAYKHARRQYKANRRQGITRQLSRQLSRAMGGSSPFGNGSRSGGGGGGGAPGPNASPITPIGASPVRNRGRSVALDFGRLGTPASAGGVSLDPPSPRERSGSGSGVQKEAPLNVRAQVCCCLPTSAHVLPHYRL